MIQVSADFGSGPGEVVAARSFARLALSRWGVREEEVVLVVAELAANAWRHGGGDFLVSLSLAGQVVTVEIADHGASMPVLKQPGPNDISGRGLLIVDRVARTWGIRPEAGGGKTVWVQVPLDEPRRDAQL